MKAVIDLDDFSILRSRMDLLEKLHDHFPGFKISLFTIPFDYEYEMSDLRVLREEALTRIHKNLDWMQFIPHGMAHIPREFENCDKQTMIDYINNVEEVFKKDGLPMTKGFKAPYWLWNQDVVDALNESGWWGANDIKQPGMLKTKRFYEYTNSIDEDLSKLTGDVVKLHGHMTPPSTNDIDRCFLNLMKLPIDTEWHFATDFIV